MDARIVGLLRFDPIAVGLVATILQACSMSETYS